MTWWKITLSILAALSASLALADDFKTINGKEYKNATISRVEPDGIVLKTKSGISKIYFTELPKDVQERFHYDPEKAAAAGHQQQSAVEKAAAAEQQQQRAVAQQRKADEQAEQVAQRFETRLGETFDQCVQRYGPLIRKIGDPDNPQFIFEKDGITIGINFLDGKAGQISYSRPAGSRFSDLEVQGLLDVNSGGSAWEYDEAESHRLHTTTYSQLECFKRKDGGAFAEHLVVAQIGTHFVNITSAEYKKAVSAKQLHGL